MKADAHLVSKKMSQRSQFFAVLFWAALAFGVSCVLLPNAASVAQVQEQRATSAERGLSPAERRGKAIYLRGASPSGKEITAMVGDMDLPASTLNCAGCHGLRGEVKTEGGVTAGYMTLADMVMTSCLN